MPLSTPGSAEADRTKLLPFYLVIDASWSMDGERLDEANNYLPVLTDALLADPIVNDKARFALLDFADEANVVLPLCDLTQQDQLPVLTARGGTSYAAAFRLLHRQIETDVQLLRNDGFAVYRPAVFFISDGQPNDREAEWRQAFRELTDYDPETGIGNKWFPNVVPFGVAEADLSTMKALIHPPKRSKAFMQASGAKPQEALAQIAEILIATTLNSGEAGGLRLPDADAMPQGIESHSGYEEDLLS